MGWRKSPLVVSGDSGIFRNFRLFTAVSRIYNLMFQDFRNFSVFFQNFRATLLTFSRNAVLDYCIGAVSWKYSVKIRGKWNSTVTNLKNKAVLAHCIEAIFRKKLPDNQRIEFSLPTRRRETKEKYKTTILKSNTQGKQSQKIKTNGS